MAQPAARSIDCADWNIVHTTMSLVDHDVTDDTRKNAVDAVWLGDDFDVDEATTQRSTVRGYSGALDVHRRPIEGAVDARHRATEPARRRHRVLGARQTTAHVDVDPINLVPLAGEKYGVLAFSKHPRRCNTLSVAESTSCEWGGHSICQAAHFSLCSAYMYG